MVVPCSTPQRLTFATTFERYTTSQLLSFQNTYLLSFHSTCKCPQQITSEDTTSAEAVHAIMQGVVHAAGKHKRVCVHLMIFESGPLLPKPGGTCGRKGVAEEECSLALLALQWSPTRLSTRFWISRHINTCWQMLKLSSG